jgi:diguanylate cyclase (GGDEF)-like protein
MPDTPTPGTDRATERLHVFRLVESVQAGEPQAADELDAAVGRAITEDWPEVVRVGLFGQSVAAWLRRDGTAAECARRLLERSRADGDRVMTSLALALSATFFDEHLLPSEQDAALAKATVMLDSAEGPALERITAHTACAIAFTNRWLWELGDEQYACALAVAAAEPPGTVDLVLTPVIFNMAEIQVSWASTLAQLGDTDGVADRGELWASASGPARSLDIPEAWRRELDSLGLLLEAIAGRDVAEQARTTLDSLADHEHLEPRSAGHLKLAVALSDSNANRPVDRGSLDEALTLIDPKAHPHVYDLALFLAGSLEATDGRNAGMRYGRRQLEEHWASRLAALGAMQSRIAAERLSSELDTLNQQAYRDDLTTIGNRRALERYMVDLRQRGIDSVAFIMTDVDRFKAVNDEHGHQVGDSVLIGLARIIEGSVRPTDLAVRLGGDEFLLVLADADLTVARQRAETVMEQVAAKAWDSVSPGLRVTVSIGVAIGPPRDLYDVAARADHMLYAAKAAGGKAVMWE